MHFAKASSRTNQRLARTQEMPRFVQAGKSTRNFGQASQAAAMMMGGIKRKEQWDGIRVNGDRFGLGYG